MKAFQTVDKALSAKTAERAFLHSRGANSVYIKTDSLFLNVFSKLSIYGTFELFSGIMEVSNKGGTLL